MTQPPPEAKLLLIADSPLSTTKQKEAIHEYIRLGSFSAAGKSLGVAHSSISGRIAKAVGRYDRQNTGVPSPEGFEVVRVNTDGEGAISTALHKPIPVDGAPIPSNFSVSRLSTYSSATGEVIGQWSRADVKKDEQWKLFTSAVESFASKYTGFVARTKAPTVTGLSDDLCALYCLGDMHVGLYATAVETGQSMDTKTIVKLGIDATRKLVAKTPACKTAYLMEVGDFFHCHDGSNATAKSSNRLDVDGRFTEVAAAGFELLVEMVNIMRSKHETIHIMLAQGNHDEEVLVWCMTAFLKATFQNDPNVIVHGSDQPIMTTVWGKNLIGLHHGHTIKMKDIPALMPVLRKDVWSEIVYCCVITGHIHHERKIEDKGVVVESKNTLNVPDVWHVSKGYIGSGRSFESIFLNRKGGEGGRARVNVLNNGDII